MPFWLTMTCGFPTLQVLEHSIVEPISRLVAIISDREKIHLRFSATYFDDH